MAGDIKGITIEFNGDTTKLGKALNKVKSESKDVDKALKDVNKSLKFNPHNTELLAQKQQLLGQKIQLTKDKLEALKAAQRELDKDPSVDKTAADYQELRRDIIKTESQLKNLTSEAKKLGNVKLTALSKQLDKIGDKAKSVGKSMTFGVTAPIVAGFTVASKYASDYEENLNKIDVAFGDNADEVKNFADNASEAYGLSKVAASSAVSSFGALGKGIGLADDDAAEMAMTLTGLTADLGSYFNTSNDDAAKALEGIFTGESEALKRFGVVMTDTNLKAFAEDCGLVWEEMDQNEKTTLRYQYVLAKTKDAQGDFSRTSDGTANSLKQFKAATEDLSTTLGESLLPIITPIVQKLTEFVEWFSGLPEPVQNAAVYIGLFIAAVGPLAWLIGGVVSAIGGLLGIIPVIAGALAPFAGIIIGIITAIGLIILAIQNWDVILQWFKEQWAAFTGWVQEKWQALGDFLTNAWAAIRDTAAVMWENIKTKIIEPFQSAWESLKQKASDIKSSLSNAWTSIKTTASTMWEEIKEAVTSPFTRAKEKISEIIDTIKGFFPISLGKIFSNISLPHFTVDGGEFPWGIGGKGHMPSFDVEWYDKGGIFGSPTIIGVGEKRPEFVGALDDLRQIVREEQNAELSKLIKVIAEMAEKPSITVNQTINANQTSYSQQQREAAYQFKQIARSLI